MGDTRCKSIQGLFAKENLMLERDLPLSWLNPYVNYIDDYLSLLVTSQKLIRPLVLWHFCVGLESMDTVHQVLGPYPSMVIFNIFYCSVHRVVEGCKCYIPCLDPSQPNGVLWHIFCSLCCCTWISLGDLWLGSVMHVTSKWHAYLFIVFNFLHNFHKNIAWLFMSCLYSWLFSHMVFSSTNY